MNARTVEIIMTIYTVVLGCVAVAAIAVAAGVRF